ncbi:pyruvate dehydrogenase complex E1 component subunit beta [Brevundimonas sp.]|uniref:pyruvate dehydrogenase complex E1 component subunit beta n=1 Tax=Brevundimonas sp. TaxID=1871086 RepID=UPI001AC8B10E|nr:pyruvate dehydrogenase complex E1 component subunit beta [Brevundimonas sp.]MBN9464401.1 pyruvate dehydrogenase complex E1 component subunit beta [Brevundimonas sp.]
MTDILMPALSPTMEEGTLTKWHIKAGDTVSAGQVIAEIETDKATMEVEAVDEGEVLEILVPEGSENVKVNTPIARLAGEDGAAAPAPKADAAKAETDAPKATTEGKTGDPEKAPAQTVSPKVELRDPEIPADAKLVKTTIRDALRDAMAEEMRRDENVFLMGEEVAQYQGAYKVSRELLQEFGERRVIDTPITEYGFAGVGVGAAMAGLRPIVEFMTFNFAMQAIDHIINSAAKTLYMSGGQIRCPMVFRGPNGAASRVAAQHSQDYSAWYAQVPGLKVIAPYDAADAKGLLKAAIRDPNPVVFLEHEMMYGLEFDVPEVEDWIVPIGKAKVRREGKDVTITAHSRMVGFALQAAEKLAEEGIDCEVVDIRTLRPLDTDTIVDSVKKTSRLVSAEEGWGRMGVGAEVVACVIAEAFDYLDAPPLRVHQEDVPLPYAANLEVLSLPGVDKIVAAVKQVMA